MVDDVVRKCCECGGEGGWWIVTVIPRDWVRCHICYGFGWRSAAADRWFADRATVRALPE